MLHPRHIVLSAWPLPLQPLRTALAVEFCSPAVENCSPAVEICSQAVEFFSLAVENCSPAVGNCSPGVEMCSLSVETVGHTSPGSVTYVNKCSRLVALWTELVEYFTTFGNCAPATMVNCPPNCPHLVHLAHVICLYRGVDGGCATLALCGSEKCTELC